MTVTTETNSSGYIIHQGWQITTQQNVECEDYPGCEKACVEYGDIFPPKISNFTKSDDTSNFDVKVFPNPSNKYINFQFNNNIKKLDISEIIIVNNIGQEILSFHTDKKYEYTLITDKFPSGIYHYMVVRNGFKYYIGQILINQ